MHPLQRGKMNPGLHTCLVPIRSFNVFGEPCVQWHISVHYFDDEIPPHIDNRFFHLNSSARKIQRAWESFRKKSSKLAFCMAAHERLGKETLLTLVGEPGLLKMICEKI